MRESHTLDGRTIFQWRAEYADMVTQFIAYADHQSHCIAARAEHWHARLAGWDTRAICTVSPCTCGVLIILILVAPETQWIHTCPDEPIPLPLPTRPRPHTRPVLNPDGTQFRIFNIPVVEAVPDDSDSVPKTD